MNPKQFLIIGGIVLVVVGLLGFGLIGPTAEQSLFGETWWFDSAENWAHLILGILALVIAFALPAAIHKPVVITVGVVGLFFGVYNFFGTEFLGANLESPADLILHLIVGAWALTAAFKSTSSSPMTTPVGGDMPQQM